MRDVPFLSEDEMSRYIYADNAATTKLDIDAFEAMKPYLLDDFGNASQPYFFSKRPKMAIRKARKTIAECIGAEPEEIYFTSGGSESDNWAIKKGSQIYGGDVVTSQIEHHAILNACKSVSGDGVTVKYLPVDVTGVVKTIEAERMIDENTGLVSVMMANNEIGSIQPIKELAIIAHNNNALFHTDAVQAVGHIPIDVKEMNIDLLSASAHKFNGPKGIGFMYVKRGISIQPYMDGGSQENGLRAGTENVAAIVGMAIALKNNIANMQTTKDYLRRLEKIVVEKLSDRKIDYLLNGNKEKIPGNISLSFRDCEGEVILHRMDLMGICISTGSACDSVNTQVSHVIKAIGLPMDYAEGTIRISFGRYNDENDAQTLVKALISIVG